MLLQIVLMLVYAVVCICVGYMLRMIDDESMGFSFQELPNREESVIID